MRFLADENVDDQIVYLLRANGYDLAYVKEISPGIDDETVLALALDTISILITTDKDFGELVYRRQQKHAGVVLLRLDSFTPEERAITLLNVFQKHLSELKGAFTVVQAHFTRIRPM